MPRQKNTKELILNATIELLATKGLVATSTRAIAKAVNISENTIYRHYADKDELIQSVFLNANQSITTFLKDNDNAENNPNDRLQAFIKSVTVWAEDNPSPFRILLNINAGRLDSLKGVEDPFDVLNDIIKAGQDVGDYREGETHWLATLTVGLLIRPLQMKDQGFAQSDYTTLATNLFAEAKHFLSR